MTNTIGSSSKAPKDTPSFADQADRLIVKPLSRRMIRETEEIERYLRGLLAAIQVEFELTRRELLHRLRELEEAVELVARELARRRRDDPGANGDVEPRSSGQP